MQFLSGKYVSRKGFFMSEKILNRYFILVWTGALCLLLIQNTMCTAIPLYLNNLGFSASFSGILGIPFAVFSIAARISGGYLMDRFNRRSVMIIGCMLMGIASLFFGLFPAAVLMIIFRGLHGAGFAFGQAAFSTANVEVTPKEKSNLGVGIFWISTALSLACTGYMIQFLSKDGDYTRIFLVCFLLGLTGVVISLLCNYEKGKKSFRALSTGPKKLLEPTAAPTAVIEFFVMLGAACSNIFILAFAAEQGYIHAGAFLLISAIAMTAGTLSTDALMQLFGAKNVLGAAMVVSGILTALIAVVPCPLTYYLGGIGFGMAQGFSFPVLTVLTVANAPIDRRGTANSTMLMAGDIGMGIGTFLWGAVINGSSYFTAFIFAGICIMAGGILTFFLCRRSLEQRS